MFKQKEIINKYRWYILSLWLMLYCAIAYAVVMTRLQLVRIYPRPSVLMTWLRGGYVKIFWSARSSMICLQYFSMPGVLLKLCSSKSSKPNGTSERHTKSVVLCRWCVDSCGRKQCTERDKERGGRANVPNSVLMYIRVYVGSYNLKFVSASIWYGICNKCTDDKESQIIVKLLWQGPMTYHQDFIRCGC